MDRDTHSQLCRALAVARRDPTCGVESGLEAANAVLNGYGIEHVDAAGRSLSYVNLGDTYDATVCHENGAFWIGNWVDWYEEAEDAHCEAENVIRCGWCSEFTPVDLDDWHDTVCESCGKHVDGGD